MIERNEIWRELKDLDSPLADLSRHMPYAVPEDYFAPLSEALTQGVFWSQSEEPMLPDSKAMPFDTPQGYFAALPDRLAEAAIHNTNIEGATHLEVPDNYFKDLPQTLLEAVKEAEQLRPRIKTIPLRPLWQKKALQWAVAALLVMGIGIGTYTYVHPSSPDAKAARQLAKLDRDVIDHYISQHVDEFDTEMLESYMAVSGIDFDKSISTLNEEEIRDYLESSGSADTLTLN